MAKIAKRSLRKPVNRMRSGYGCGETPRYACLKCRVCFHRHSPCPHCRQPMRYMGTHFRAPRRQDKKAWRILAEIGFVSFRDGGGAVPTCMAEVPRAIEARKDSGWNKRAGDMILHNGGGRHTYRFCLISKRPKKPTQKGHL